MAPCVLLAEDEFVQRDSLAEILGDAGYRVVQAANGLEALRMVERENPAAVVLDLAMPLMSGWDFLRIVRAERPDLPVVLASGADEVPEGAVAFLPKPVQVPALLAAVASAAAGR
jgi:two-component system response regulator MprA